MHSLQFNFRNNYKDRVICVFPTGQKKWEVRLTLTGRQRFEQKCWPPYLTNDEKL